MRIAGIDPGTIRAGVGLLDVKGSHTNLIFSGTIHADQSKPISERLRVVFLELKVVFEEWKPDVVALESIFYQKNFKSAVKVGEARAAAMIAARLCGIDVCEYPPARVKQAVCGNGRASKDQVQYMVRHILNLKGPLSTDSSDAVAVALCHFQMNRSKQAKKAQVYV
jgi:crossover junction endodeoxyribonuclease RuvC